MVKTKFWKTGFPTKDEAPKMTVQIPCNFKLVSFFANLFYEQKKKLYSKI